MVFDCSHASQLIIGFAFIDHLRSALSMKSPSFFHAISLHVSAISSIVSSVHTIFLLINSGAIDSKLAFAASFVGFIALDTSSKADFFINGAAFAHDILIAFAIKGIQNIGIA